MRAIEMCRTAALGGHVDECDSCGARKISYNSCRNRHCPKCQGLEKQKWLEQRCRELLPVAYFHVVFTVPEELNPLALANPKWFYWTCPGLVDSLVLGFSSLSSGGLGGRAPQLPGSYGNA